jgi:hypothetical protein
MAHFKCAACRVRLWAEETPADAGSEPCPVCGRPLERAASAAELLGFQSIVPAQSESAAAPATAGYKRLADRVVEIMAQRRAAEAAATVAHPERTL